MLATFFLVLKGLIQQKKSGISKDSGSISLVVSMFLRHIYMRTFVHWPFFHVFWHPRHWPWLQSIPPWRCWPSSPLVSSFLLVELDTWTMIIVIFVYLCHVMIPGAPIKLHTATGRRPIESSNSFLGGFWWEGSDFQSGDGSAMFSLFRVVQPCSSCFCGSAMNSCTLFVHPGPGVWTPEDRGLDWGIWRSDHSAPKKLDPRCKKKIKTPPRKN